LGNNVTINASSPVTIAGSLNLGGGTRTLTVNDGPAMNDLRIDAAISNGRVVKAGTGLLLLTNAGNTYLADVSEIQSVTVPTTVTTFTLTFNGATTAAIPYTTGVTPASDLQTALEGLATIGVGNAVVSGVAGGPYTVTFQGLLAGQDVQQLTG